MDNLFLLYSSESILFSFLLRLLNLFLGGFHLLDVMIQEVFLELWTKFRYSIINNSLAFDSDSLNQIFKFLVLAHEVNSPGSLSKYQICKYVDTCP